ncbi:MAG TPA: DUF4365 domain-containing protein [Alicyclobacillus sp.]|nr:DUF4365 domain-containing protein [Alicyclobacillus sp.]
MDLSHSKEQFSLAYVKAVASVAGFAVERISVDLDSEDVMICSRSSTGRIRSPRLDVQLKCTASAVMKEDVIKYPLKIKNYDDLIPENLLVPRILVIVLVPEDPSEWLDQTEECMAMRHCGYWVSLKGMPPTKNETSVTIEIPRTHVFSVDALKRIMLQIGEGAFQ